MADYKITTTWQRESADFTLKTYNRSHQWCSEGGVSVAASAPQVYGGEADKVNPEQAFTAALSSCHLLTFLAIAATKGFCVDSYEDHAVAKLGKLADGRTAVTKVTLQPNITFSGDKMPTHDELQQLHHMAHKQCFIANSVTTEVEII